MFLFSAAAFFGGIAHQIDMERTAIGEAIASANGPIPEHLRIGDLGDIYVRVWFVTLLCVGATEYYFMHIFLHPLARALGKTGYLRVVQASFVLFCLATLLTYDYAIVIVFHVMSHLVVIGIAVWLIRAHGLSAYYALIGLCVYNLGTGLMWAMMGLDRLPDGPLHYNDWYHLALIGFVVALHQLLTRFKLAERLESPTATGGFTAPSPVTIR
jgi:hypothetical protein